jgi:hypothetical protein
MAGVCIICKNLSKKELLFDSKKLEGCRCLKGKYDKDGLEGFYSLTSVRKESKAIKEIEDNCELWDDALAAKNPQQ